VPISCFRNARYLCGAFFSTLTILNIMTHWSDC
jgi:hypothetical protein